MCLPLETHTFIHTLFTAEVSLNTVKNNAFFKKKNFYSVKATEEIWISFFRTAAIPMAQSLL